VASLTCQCWLLCGVAALVVACSPGCLYASRDEQCVLVPHLDLNLAAAVLPSGCHTPMCLFVNNRFLACLSDAISAISVAAGYEFLVDLLKITVHTALCTAAVEPSQLFSPHPTARYWVAEFFRQNHDGRWAATVLGWMRQESRLAAFVIEDLGLEVIARVDMDVALGERVELACTEVRVAEGFYRLTVVGVLSSGADEEGQDLAGPEEDGNRGSDSASETFTGGDSSVTLSDMGMEGNPLEHGRGSAGTAAEVMEGAAVAAHGMGV